MDTTTLLISLSAAGGFILLAVLLTRALTRSRLAATYESVQAKLETERDHLQEEKAALIRELDSVKTAIPQQIQQAVAAAEKAKDKLMEARDRAHEEAMQALQVRFDETIGKVTAQVRADTAKMLQERQKEFSDSSAKGLGLLMDPLKEKLETLRKAMDENSTVHKTAESAIKSDVETLMHFAGKVSKSADSLAAAFKYGNKLQGTWGETILEELLSSQGLTRGIHFDVQPTITDADGKPVKSEDGSTMRPDVILHLDTRREVIVDAKTSLSAYVSYVNADNEEDRVRYLKAHVDSIRSHVKELARKNYAAYVRPPKVSAGYVIMFVPNMGALWTALNAEPDLWRNAAEQNVYIADEQSLYGAIRIVQLTWTQVQQEQNHEKVFALADEIVDRVEKFLASYEDIGKALGNAAKAYEAGHKKLEPGGQSILNSAGKLIKMGAASKGKHLTRSLVDIEDIEKTQESLQEQPSDLSA